MLRAVSDSLWFTYINEYISQAHQFLKKNAQRGDAEQAHFWLPETWAFTTKEFATSSWQRWLERPVTTCDDLCIVQDSKPKTQRQSTIINDHQRKSTIINYNSNASCLWNCAPFSSKSRRIATFPVRHAICNAVRRVSVVLASLSAPASIKRRTTWAERCAQRRSESCRVLFFDT